MSLSCLMWGPLERAEGFGAAEKVLPNARKISRRRLEQGGRPGDRVAARHSRRVGNIPLDFREVTHRVVVPAVLVVIDAEHFAGKKLNKLLCRFAWTV